MDRNKLVTFAENLRRRGFEAEVFQTGSEAAAHIVDAVRGASVGIGGCTSAKQVGLYEKLKDAGCDVTWHWIDKDAGAAMRASRSRYYVASVNGASLDGMLVNIDGNANRVASIMYGPERTFLLVGRNKIKDSPKEAWERAIRIAVPRNAARLGVKPAGEETGSLESYGSFCGQIVLLTSPAPATKIRVLIVDEDLGL